MSELIDIEHDLELRQAVGRAIQEWLNHRNATLVDVPSGAPFIIGWAVSLEYTTSDLDREDMAGVCALVPKDQSGTLTRGLFEKGCEIF